MSDYIPRADGDFAQWIRLQKATRAAAAAALHYTPADVTHLDAEDDAMLAALDKKDKAHAASKSATTECDELEKTYLTARRAAINRDKTNANYSEALGKACGWVAPEERLDPDALKPSLKATTTAEGVRLDWSKKGQDYIQIFRRAAGTSDWGRYLAIDSRPPYIDTEQGLKGAYEYKGQLFHDDRPVGQPSDVVVVVLG